MPPCHEDHLTTLANLRNFSRKIKKITAAFHISLRQLFFAHGPNSNEKKTQVLCLVEVLSGNIKNKIECGRIRKYNSSIEEFIWFQRSIPIFNVAPTTSTSSHRCRIFSPASSEEFDNASFFNWM